MINFNYPQTIYKPVQNNYLTDTDILGFLDQLKVKQYTNLERLDNQLIVKFTFQGDQFVTLYDLMNFKLNNVQCFQVDYAFAIIYSILAEFQNKYEQHQVNFNSEEIWIKIKSSPNATFDVIFSSIDFDKQSNTKSDIGSLKGIIFSFLELFQESDIQLIKEVYESLEKCNQINEAQNIIKKYLKPSQQLKLNYNIVDKFQNLVDIFKKSNEISQKGENYDILRNNIINWVAKGNYKLETVANLKDLFVLLQLQATYKILTQWDDLDDIFIILKEYEILNSHQRLQNINDFIFLLTFPKQRLRSDSQITLSYSKQTLDWVEQLEKLILYKITHYIQNITEFYKGDREEWHKVDFKCIFNKVRQYLNDSEGVEQTIQNQQSLKGITLAIIKAYYQEKVDGLNQEIIKIMFKKK
ncbi:unnamed protein product [Paramecium octaurelia]|uniref:Uncharacterized protein n=1 Tax=Paramecium octaurelia TaxID=43137 RepID=A0A8S1W4D0_PAROT|nr:unnamed protein product [Paramecium octaurelia]